MTKVTKSRDSDDRLTSRSNNVNRRSVSKAFHKTAETTSETATNCRSVENINKRNGKSEKQGAKNGFYIPKHIYLSNDRLLGFDFL